MKKFLSVLASLVLFYAGVCQVRGNMGEGRLGTGNVKWDDQFIILDRNGSAFRSYYDGVEGHPFFIEEFKRASVTLSSGEKFENLSARLDLYKQMVQIRSGPDTAKYILPGNVSEIIFFDTINAIAAAYKFHSGYPETDRITGSNFYQLLCDGKVSFLKSSIKKINKLKNDMTGEMSSQFDLYEDYYFYINNEMKRLKKDKEYILDLFSDKKKELELYCSSQKINFKSIESIKRLVDYYNTITPQPF